MNTSSEHIHVWLNRHGLTPANTIQVVQVDIHSKTDAVAAPSLTELRNEVAQRLATQELEIENEFEKLARQTLPAARNLDRAALIDHLPDMIRVIIHHLENRDALPPDSKEEKKISRAHGRQRANLSSYTMEQILAEHRLFRKVLFDALEKDASSIPSRERDTILDLIQLGAKHAASQFMHARVIKARLGTWAPRNVFAESAVVLGLVAAATGLQYSLGDHLSGAPYTIYYPMVIFASFVANGIAVTLVSALAVQYFFLDPIFSLRMHWPSDFIRMGLFMFNGMLISFIIGRLRKLESAATESSNEQESAKRDMESVNRKLETEQELRDQFVNTLSHDLRSPLTTIKMSAEMLARNRERPEGQDKLHARIRESAERIDHMIQDLLDVSRIRAGEPLPLSKEYCELYPLVDDLVDELRLIHGDRFILEGEKGIEGVWNCGGIRRIVENLATNAVKYGATNALIRIRLYREGDFVKLSVHNELARPGAALTESQIASLFKPFQRTREAETSGKKGWGLGLTLVKGLAEAHGGKVEIVSSAKTGTTFIVSIPR